MGTKNMHSIPSSTIHEHSTSPGFLSDPIFNGKRQVILERLVPGLRSRLIVYMNESKIEANKRLSYLASLTGRAQQTVRRWIDPVNPGLPDLESFALLCAAFGGDANRLLGSTGDEHPLPVFRSEANSTCPIVCLQHYLTSTLGELLKQAYPYDLVVMQGDEMHPTVREGDSLLVDRRVRVINGNGLYLINYQGFSVVRHIEVRVGEGVFLRCENPRYSSSRCDRLEADQQLEVQGKVMGALALHRF